MAFPRSETFQSMELAERVDVFQFGSLKKDKEIQVALKRIGVSSLFDLCNRTRRELVRAGISATNLKTIRSTIDELGFSCLC